MMGTNNTGKQNKKVCWCMGYFNFLYQFKGHIYLNEKPFFQIRFTFSTILGFWVHFWGSGAKCSDFLKNFVCTSDCTRNNHLNPTCSIQKSVWKTNHPGLRYLRTTNLGCGLVWRAMLKTFLQLSRLLVVHFKRILHRNRWIEMVVLTTIN